MGPKIPGLEHVISSNEAFHLERLPKKILIGGDGNVVSVQEEVPFAQLPPEIQSGLRQQAGRGRIDRVVAISKNTAVTSYQTRVAANGKTSRIEVGVDGKPPAPPGSPEPVP